MARLLLALALTACYSPGVEPSCTISCASATCPTGYGCTEDKLCALPGETCGSVVVTDGADCYGTGTAPYLRFCPAFSFPQTLTLPPVIDTDACAHTLDQLQSGSPELCVIAADDIIVSGSVTVTGSRPLLLFGRRIVTVSLGAKLDVAAYADSSVRAAGAPGLNCKASSGSTSVATMVGGGGGGGSFGGEGGVGGRGDGGGVPGGLPGEPATPVFLRGGCPGGQGGLGTDGVRADAGGGGGAVYVMADIIEILGTVTASGGGGGTAKRTGGGGGGGSGGMIILDGNKVMIAPSGAVFALGGGGASGGAETVSGNPGFDPRGVNMYAGTSPALGMPAGAGGAGGNPELGADGDNGGTNTGGGGGGGGGGVIFIQPPGQYALVDPAPR